MTEPEDQLEEPEEPEEPEQPEPGQPGPDVGSTLPSVGTGEPGLWRTFEYRSEVITLEEVADGTLVKKLNQSSEDGWDLVEVLAAQDGKQVVLMRRPKRADRTSRPVGFMRSG